MAKKYHEFNVGRAGNGAIDLATGKLTFIHQNTDAESTILPVSVSHVFQSDKVEQENNLYGKGWKLNLNQTLHRFSLDDPNDTRYIYTDGSGVEHEFEEKYFYRVDKERQFYLPNATTKIKRSDIRIDLDGRMWLVDDETIEIFSELVTDSGLILQIRPKGFLGSEKIETRHEELIRVEAEMKSLNRQIKDLEFQISQNSVLDESISIENRTFNTLRDLQLFIQEESNRLEKQSIIEFFDGVDDQDELMREQSILRDTTRKSSHSNMSTISVSGLNGDNAENASFSHQRTTRWTYNNNNARWMDSISTRHQFWAMEGSPYFPNNDGTRRGRAITHYQRLYQTAVEQIQDRIQTISRRMEERNWDNIQNSNEKRSILLRFQEEFQKIQDEFSERRTELMLERWNEDLTEMNIQLARAKHTYKQLVNLLPVNYIIDENILGFNEYGNLVAIFDNYDNQVAILYEDDRLIRVIDSEERTINLEYINNRLDHIKDFQERTIYFKYNLDNELKEVIYPDKEISSFKYDSNHVITDIIPPSKIGIRLIIDDRHRVDKLINISLASKISNDGIEIGDEQTEEVVVIEYNSLRMQTNIIEPRTREQVVYFFNEDGDVIHEHIQGNFEQFFKTYYECDEHEVGIEEEILKDSNILEIKEQHIKWSKEPNTLPTFNEKLIWNVTYLNVEGNPTKRYFSEKSLASDESIRQRIEETFTYKRFIDGRQPLLVRSDTLIVTTNKPNRNLSEEYFYDKQGSLIRTVSLPDGIVEENGYNNKGIVTSSVVYNRATPDKRFVNKVEVNEDGQVMASYDESGQHKTTYDYVKNTSKVKRTTDPRGGRVVLGRDFASNKLNSMSSSSKGERNAIKYNHTDDFLTKLESSNTSFEYSYDGLGRATAIYVNGEDKPYVYYEYSVEKRDVYNGMGLVECDVVTTTYASDEVYINYTDKFGRLLAIHYKGNNQVERAIITNFYEDNKVVKTLDYKINETILFEYDIRGNVVKQTIKGIFDNKIGEIPSQYLSISQNINIDGAIDKLTYEIDNRSQTYKFEYKDEIINQIHLPSDDILKVNTDEFDRGKKIEILSNNEKLLSEEASFLQYSDRTTNLINSHTQRIGKENFNKTHYTYDESGNIRNIRQAGKIIANYEYDELNRLIREDNRKLDKSYTIEYDNNGNIIFKKEFSFTLNKLTEEGNTTDYIYSDVGDQLILLNNEKFEYDILGNPIVYRNKNLKWSHLRNLESFSNVEFRYDAANLRVYKNHQKELDGINTRFETRYQWANDKLISETRTRTTNNWLSSDQPLGEFTQDLKINTTNITLDYIYDVDSKIGFTLNNNDTYYYVKNIQGDVLKVIDKKGTIVAEYVYDAWGNHEIITNVDGIAELNPIRYKSYYYDEETELYYLKSRYYDLQVGRFINMDALRYTDPENIGGLNLYAYCGNNPVMHIDPEGTIFGSIGNWFQNAWRAIVGVVVGVAVVAALVGLTVLTGGAILLVVGKALKIAGPLALKGAKAAGAKMKVGAKKAAANIKANITKKSFGAKTGIGGIFGFLDGGFDSNGNFDPLGAIVGTIVGLASGALGAALGAIVKPLSFATRALAGATLGLVVGLTKTLINGSFDLGKLITSIISGTIGIFLNPVGGAFLYAFQWISGAVTVGPEVPNGHRSNRLAH